jgi:serine/threonine-protein kinase
VLLSPDGRARLTDFGLARIEQRSRITKPGTYLGTVSSMAPEQIRAEDADARTDIWAFGVMLYQMLTRRHPFHRLDFESSMRAVLNEDPTPPSSLNPKLPSSFDRILEKALAKERSERYQHIDDLVADLCILRRGLSDEQRLMMAGAAAGADAPTETVEQRSWFGRLFRSR